MPDLTTSAIRTPLDNFPDVIIHAPETAVKKHPRYKDAKAGDSDAAIELVQKTIQCCPVWFLLYSPPPSFQGGDTGGGLKTNFSLRAII
jgi:hypothetical protein